MHNNGGSGGGARGTMRQWRDRKPIVILSSAPRSVCLMEEHLSGDKSPLIWFFIAQQHRTPTNGLQAQYNFPLVLPLLPVCVAFASIVLEKV